MRPIGSEARDSFIAVILIAAIVAVLSGSVPAAVAVGTIGGLGLGAALTIRAHRAGRHSGPKVG